MCTISIVWLIRRELRTLTSRCRSHLYVYLPKEAGTQAIGTARGERKLTTMHDNSGSNNETVFTMEATPLKYGPGASQEVGWELKQMGVERVMLASDPGVVEAGITGRVRELIEAEGIEVEVWD